ncbi:adrenomedullin a [Alosa pseudoharengus]|uniref:adrenomedullin a n=1 Tax=Alosa pseudoharengus TaxID=34774 RepID=UPI003F895D3B
MSILVWCVLSCFGVLTSARPRMDTDETASHSVPALGGSREPDASVSVTNQRPGEMLPFVRAQDIRDALLHARTSPLVVRRLRRSKPAVNQSRRGGCSLGTCTVHDLAHRLNQLNNRLKITQAPLDKISPQGYGRRRRALNTHTHTLQRSTRALPTHTLQRSTRALPTHTLTLQRSTRALPTHTLTLQRSTRALPTHTLTLRRRGLGLQPVWTSTLTHT